VFEPTEDLVPRRIAGVVSESLDAFRVVVVHGARQVGKTTLVLGLAGERGAGYVSLDDEAERNAADLDPQTYLSVHGTPLVIDEIQRVGERLVLAVKLAVDTQRGPGQFLLTGSTNFLTVPTISESLAGRVDIVTLWPMSQGELTEASDGLIDRAFTRDGDLLGHRGSTPGRDDYLRALCAGGYPGAQQLAGRSRARWFAQYVETVLRREVEVAQDLRRVDALAAMVRYFAANSGQELVLSTAAQRLGIDRATASVYQPWLETTFLVHRVPAWSRNLTAKVVRRPKMFLADSGMAAALLGKDPLALRRPTDPATGPLFETFLVAELAKQLTWSQTTARLFHFRDRDGIEVDTVIEAADGRVVAMEMKATSTPRADDFRGLAFLRDRVDRAGGEFLAGIVLHTGTARLGFGDRLLALPAADIWT
jgi:predicted AAA+ superfamily ATPase